MTAFGKTIGTDAPQSGEAHSPRLSMPGTKPLALPETIQARSLIPGRNADGSPDVFYALDEIGNILKVNRAVSALGYKQAELPGRFFLDLVHPDDRSRMARAYIGALSKRQTLVYSQRFRLLARSGEVRWTEVNCIIVFSPQASFVMHEGLCRDITEDMQNRPVSEEPSGLPGAEPQPEKQPAASQGRQLPKGAKKGRRDREKTLELEKATLQEANTALQVLLERRELDKRALEEQVLHNITRLVLPYLERIRTESDNPRHKDFVDIVESNLNDITCNFSRRLSLGLYGLSAAELRVANLVRQGRKTRQIAQMLGLSPRTVDSYRQSIRYKLRIRNKSINLRTFLMSIR